MSNTCPTIRELYGHTKIDGIFGVEIEVEAMEQLPTINTNHWNSKADNSLRYIGMEYVSRGVIKPADLPVALEYITSRIKKVPLLITDSPRTSVHVHRNVGEYTPNKVWNAIIAYWLLEETLFKYCGEDRKGNLFCLRLKDASGVLETCKQDLASNRPFHTFSQNDRVRYSGLNLCAVPRFGSLEFRGLRGVYDYDIILNWCNIVNSLIDGAQNFDNPQHLMDVFFDSKDKLEFAKQLLGSMFNKLEHTDTVKDMNHSIKYILPLIYGTDWKEYEERVTDVFHSRNKPNKLHADTLDAIAQFNANNANQVRLVGVGEIAGGNGGVVARRRGNLRQDAINLQEPIGNFVAIDDEVGNF